MSKQFKLNHHIIQYGKDLDTYEQSVIRIGINPFFCKELIRNNISENQDLCYFNFFSDEKLIIVMPFYKRRIEHNIDGESYYDIISPYGYTGPLISDEASESDIVTFWNFVDSWYKEENVVAEFIRFSLNNNITGYTGVLIPSLKNVKGEIVESETQWQQFKAKVRNNYRKAIKEDLKLKIFTKEKLNTKIVSIFYEIYISTMKRNNATTDYFHSKEYFENFVENNKNYAAIGIVFKDEIPISTELILIHNKTLYSFLGGTLAEYFSTRPNDFLKIKVMDWARENNFKNYVLGGGRCDDDPLYRYKKSFFPKNKDVIFYTGRKIVNLAVYKKLSSSFSKEKVCNLDITAKDSFFPYYRKSV